MGCSDPFRQIKLILVTVILIFFITFITYKMEIVAETSLYVTLFLTRGDSTDLHII